MEEILKYENRESLYQALLKEPGLIKVNEYYDSKNFGNWFVSLASQHFFIDYVNDRSFLDIQIRSKFDPPKSFSLSFIRDLIYNPANLNSSGEKLDNASRIKELNEFLRVDFEKINELYSPENYNDTRTKIDQLLKERFYRRTTL